MAGNLNPIIYRPINITDLPLRVKWLNDPEINKYLGTRTRQGTTLAFHQEWFERYEKEEVKKIFIILYEGKPIGQVGLVDIDYFDHRAELYVIIGEKEYWGRGIAKEALKFICDYGFSELKLHKINLDVYANNERAIRCYKSFGFKVEGVRKENVFVDGAYRDEIEMAIINEESK